MALRDLHPMVTFFLAVLSYTSAGEPVKEAWVARYDGPSSGVDWATAMAMDGSGNVYVTGASSQIAPYGCSDYVTVKYDGTGKELWLARYDGTGHCMDSAVAIAVDGAGNVIVTGHSDGSEPDWRSEYATVKYDGDGKELWAARFKGPKGMSAIPSDMAVDGSGNIYVTGTDIIWDESYDIWTVKYDPAGNQLWAAAVLEGSSEKSARSIALDPSGNVLVLGSFNWAGFVLLKYDGDGNLLWKVTEEGSPSYHAGGLAVDGSGNIHALATKRIDSTAIWILKYGPDGGKLWDALYPAGSGDPGAIALDLSGNVCVVGWTYFDTPRLVVLKYDPQGNLLWSDGGDEIEQSSTRSIAIDPSGNVLAACATAGFSFLTAKFSPQGERLWTSTTPESGGVNEGPFEIVSDHQGNVHVTGTLKSPVSGEDYMTLKYGPDGKLIWKARYDGLGSGSDAASRIVLDGPGDIIVSGASYAAGPGIEFATVKYDPQGRQLWAARFDPPGEQAGLVELAVDSSGGIYILGGFSPLIYTERYDFVVVKYDALGNQLWASVYDGTEDSWTTATGMAVGEDGSVHVVGVEDDGIVVKLDPQGDRLWTAPFPRGPGATGSRAEAVALDRSGNAYVTGSTGQPASNYVYQTAKYDPRGNRLWLAIHDRHPERGDYAWLIALGDDGIYVGGSSDYSPTYATSTFVKYDFDGNLLWETEVGVRDVDYFGVSAIALDGEGNLYAAGESTVPIPPYSMAPSQFSTLKLERSGGLLWKVQHGAPGSQGDVPKGIAVDGAGNVYVTGDTRDRTDEWLTIKYDPEGKELWAERFDGGGSSLSDANDIALDRMGNAYVAGSSHDPVQGGDYVTVKYESSPVVPVSFIRGDCNADGEVRGSLSDAIFLLDYNFLGGAAPPCFSACDANGDGKFLGEVGDAVFLINFNFLSGGPPPPPYPVCGEGPGDLLGCESFPKC